MTPEQWANRIRSHIFHPLKWTRYWLFYSWGLVLSKIGFGCPVFPLPTELGAEKTDVIVAQTFVLDTGMRQRMRTLFGGQMVFRVTYALAPGNLIVTASQCRMCVMPPGLKFEAKDLDKKFPHGWTGKRAS